MNKSFNCKRISKALLLLCYFLIIAYITLLCRKQMLVADTDRMFPFWSYVSWAHGDWMTGVQIIQNVMMFVPFGFILCWCLSGVLKAAPARRCALISVLVSLGFSICIESSQLIFKLGTFEFDDLFDNTLGGFIGVLIFLVASRVIKVEKAFAIVSAVFVVVGIAVCITFVDRSDTNLLEQQFAFQVDNMKINATEDQIRLEGFCFVYQDPGRDYEIWLRDVEADDFVKMDTVSGLESADVDAYYKCEYDYSWVRFTAECECRADARYEIFVKWPRMKAIYSGMDINRPAPVQCAGTYLERIVQDGVLRVCQDRKDCYVYQYGGQLYWIMGPDFAFEESGATYIQYQLNTTQVDRLPAERLANGWDWDNIGFIFEDNEITGDMDCGAYRVAVRPLPTEYAITCIQTGYYENGKWDWVKYFRPYVELDK